MSHDIHKRENELKAQSVAEVERQFGTLFFALPLQDVRKSGHPDVTFSAFDKTTWWEYKHATPRFRSPGIQEHICQRLAHTSYCRYVIYFEDKHSMTRTAIYHPEDVAGCKGDLSCADPEIEWRGIAHAHVANFIYLAHGGSGTLDSPDVMRRAFR